MLILKVFDGDIGLVENVSFGILICEHNKLTHIAKRKLQWEFLLLNKSGSCELMPKPSFERDFQQRRK